jgi:hypothetical protein
VGHPVYNKTHSALLQEAVLLRERSVISVKLTINYAMHEVYTIVVMFEQTNVYTKIMRGQLNKEEEGRRLYR